jgi:cytochrome P450
MHDETIYTNPSAFQPERFLGDSPQPDSRKFVFGFGRRSCPGMYFAESSLFINITRILATLEIKPVVDKITGKPLLPEAKYKSGIVM